MFGIPRVLVVDNPLRQNLRLQSLDRHACLIHMPRLVCDADDQSSPLIRLQTRLVCLFPCVSGWRGPSCSIGLASDFSLAMVSWQFTRVTGQVSQSTVLYQSVARARPKIEIEYAVNDQSIARHLTAEFARCTRCGILEHGFVRL